MIFIGKAPYRVSLLGGGSDLDWMVKEKGWGICLGLPLNKYSYSVLNLLPSDAKKGILEYSHKETYKNLDEIVHPIIREVLKEFNIKSFVELKTFGFAGGGSGLGGSASFLIALISSLVKAFKIKISIEKIIEIACSIELEKLKKPIGKQDQYLCSCSEISSFTFYKNNEIKENNISKSKIKVLKRMVQNFYLIPTNRIRSADTVLRNIKKMEDSYDRLSEIGNIAKSFINFNDERDYKIEEFFYKSIKDSWKIKMSLSEVMNDSLFDQYNIIDSLIPNNFIRLLGAGSGGYFLLSSKIKEKDILNLSDNKSIKGIFKVAVSSEGVSSFEI